MQKEQTLDLLKEFMEVNPRFFNKVIKEYTAEVKWEYQMIHNLLFDELGYAPHPTAKIYKLMSDIGYGEQAGRILREIAVHNGGLGSVSRWSLKVLL